jgi:hypothetical protein
MKVVGILLIVVGVAGIAYGGFSWTRQKTVFEAGPIEVKADKRESLPVPPLVGVLCLVAGGALLFTRSR